MKSLKIVLGLLILLLNSCGAPPAPTADASQVQTAAVVAAQTMIAMTQAAIPTDTPSPIPTDTPFPSPTLTIEVVDDSLVSTETAAPQSEGNTDCLHALNVGGAGPTHRTLIKNQTSAAVNLSLNLYKPNAFGECGALSYTLKKGDQVSASLPAGYWSAYGWVAGKKKFTISGSFFVQPAQFDKLELCLRKTGIKYAPAC